MLKIRMVLLDHFFVTKCLSKSVWAFQRCRVCGGGVRLADKILSLIRRLALEFSPDGEKKIKIETYLSSSICFSFRSLSFEDRIRSLRPWISLESIAFMAFWISSSDDVSANANLQYEIGLENHCFQIKVNTGILNPSLYILLPKWEAKRKRDWKYFTKS